MKEDEVKKGMKVFLEDFDNNILPPVRNRRGLNIQSKEARKKKQKEYMATLRGRILRNIVCSKRRAKIRQLIHNFTWNEWKEKLNVTEGICPMCNKYVGIDKLTLDHIIPICKAPVGFIYNIDDVQPLCFLCNSKKSDKIIIGVNNG